MGTSLTAQPQTAPQPDDRFNTFLVVCEWGFVLAATGLWVAFKTYNPLMNAGLGLWTGSWVARWLRLGKPTRQTPLDIPMLGFFVSILIAYWAAPNFGEATTRALLFVGAIGLYYAAVNSSRRGLTVICVGFITGAAFFGLYFASQHPWAQEPGKFSALQQIGLYLNQVIPDFDLYKPHPNVVAGLLAMALAVWLAFFFQQLTQPNRRLEVLAGLLLLGAALLAGLVMTQSRAAWLATAGVVGVGLWWLMAARIASRVRLPEWAVFVAGCGIGLAVAIGVVAGRPQLLTQALGTLPGPNSAESRVEIYGQVWRLAQDTPFTGGGLAAFPGLYSTYVLIVPSLYLTHAHNAFLNIFLEQGWPGGLSFAFVLFGAGLNLLPRLSRLDGQSASLAAAGGLGLAAVIIQGLGDATSVASRVTPLVFFPAGLALFNGTTAASPKYWQWYLVPLMVIVGVALAVAGPLKAQWYANLGAIEQNRVLLRGWPTNEWDEGAQAALLGPADEQMRKAIASDPENGTAGFRLGLIAMSRHDWPGAVEYLQLAHTLDTQRRGVNKTLGYAYTWLGEFDKADIFLASIPEARTELEIYSWWWNERQRRPDLSKNALIMLGRMP